MIALVKKLTRKIHAFVFILSVKYETSKDFIITNVHHNEVKICFDHKNILDVTHIFINYLT